MSEFKIGDIVENPWAGHIDIRIGIYIGENKETYQLLQNIKGKWTKGSYYKTSTVNPKEWKKVGHTNMFDVCNNDLANIKSKFNIRDDGIIIWKENK